MVQTRSSTRRNNIETNRNHSSNHINSQLLNTMHLVRPSTGESSSGDSNISSPPGYNENIIQNQENRLFPLITLQIPLPAWRTLCVAPAPGGL